MNIGLVPYSGLDLEKLRGRLREGCQVEASWELSPER
jgi:hypothetical protein